jgi:hypothetical protein
MKKILLFTALNFFALFSLLAQYEGGGKVAGFNFQGLARNASGKLMPMQALDIRISLTQREGQAPKTLYTENHKVVTDDLGLFSLSVGNGNPVTGKFNEIPWSSGAVWMDLEVRSANESAYAFIQSTQLKAVPYAFHSKTANRLVDETAVPGGEKSQSIFWITTGNSLTKPETHFLGTRDNEDLVYKTNNISRGKITKQGQFIIDVDPQAIATGTITTADVMITSYPLTIEGSSNGIYIKINGSRTSLNHFLNFSDAIGSWGAVKGETLAELQAGWSYQLRVADYSLTIATYSQLIAASTASAAANVAAATCAAATIVLAWQAPGYSAQAAGDGISLGASTTGLANVSSELSEWQGTINSKVGVSYSSGFADYAEWLERTEGERDLQFAEIVGVRGGRVSLNTSGAERVMVVSVAPAFLGNKPSPEEEHRYEKIAFVGQVKVRVAGPVRSGDYILPSGNHDGMGIAVHPEDMDFSDFPQVVGIAWESADDNPVNIVKVGVGLNRHDLSPKVAEIAGKVENILSYLEGKGPLTGTVDNPSVRARKAPEKKKLMSDEAFDAIIDQSATFLKLRYASVERQIKAAGGEISDPVLAEFIRDPVAAGKALRRDPRLEAYWADFDAMYLKK